MRRACRIRPGVTLEVMGLRVCQKTTSYAFPVVSHRTHPARTYRAVAVMKQQHLRSSDEDLTSVKALYIAPFRKIEECMAYLRRAMRPLASVVNGCCAQLVSVHSVAEILSCAEAHV